MAIQKDYKAIAAIIKTEYTRFDNNLSSENDYEGKHAITCIAQNIANYFYSRSQWFNRDTFINECGIAD